MRIPAQSPSIATQAQAAEAKAVLVEKLGNGSDTALAASLLAIPAFMFSGFFWIVAGTSSPTPYHAAVHLGELGMVVSSAVGFVSATVSAGLAGAAALVRRS